MAKKFCTVGVVADQLGIHRVTAYDWIKRGLIPGAIKLGGVVRVNQQTFDEFLKERERAARKPIRDANAQN